MAKQSSNIVSKVEEIVSPVAGELGLSLWEISFEKEGPEWFLRVLVEKEDGSPMDTDTCEKLSRAIDPLLDEADPISESYYLEVGSPGLGRKLNMPWHFKRFTGSIVEARLYKKDEKGRKELSGVLLEEKDGVVLLEIDGERLSINRKDAACFKLCDDTGLF